MSRQIKFRVWGCVTKNMLNYDEISHWSLKSLNVEMDYNINKLMQSTGLKDRDGVEIYEGDVLGSPGGFPVPARTIVKFDQKNGKFISTAITGSYIINAGAFREMAVVGNIYENPELLDD